MTSCWSKNRTRCLPNHHDYDPHVLARSTKFHLQMDAPVAFCLWQSACNPFSSPETNRCLLADHSRNLFSNSRSASNIRNSPWNISSTPLRIGKNRQMGSLSANSTVHALVKRQFMVNVE